MDKEKKGEEKAREENSRRIPHLLTSWMQMQMLESGSRVNMAGTHLSLSRALVTTPSNVVLRPLFNGNTISD
jgi:hypothetical protein